MSLIFADMTDHNDPDSRERRLENTVLELTNQLGDRDADLTAARAALPTQGGQSETQLQRIFQYTAIAIGILRGPDFVVELANPAMCALWGRTEEELLGKPIFSVLPESAEQGFEALLTGVLQTNKQFVGMELPVMLNRKGVLDKVYFDLVYEPLPDADGRVSRIKRERHVARIKTAVHGLTDLLNDFLSLGQMDQETMHGMPQPLELRAFCDEILDDMQGMMKAGQRFVYQQLTVQPIINIDGSMLRNILINLLVNASKYSSEGKAIELTTNVQDHQLVVTVKDEGIGIPDADKDKLFINFFRARNAIHVQGTGLGLYIVKRYVDLLGGTISFTSQLNSGTIFTVQLPVYPVAA